MESTSQSAGISYMVRPALFRFNDETAHSNAFQQVSVLQDDQLHEMVLKEFDAAVGVLTDAGLDIRVFSSQDISAPDSIFPNNWFSTHPDGTLVLYPMMSMNRRRERLSGLKEELIRNFEISRIVDLTCYEEEGLFLEGTGSVVFDHAARTAYAALSPRTCLPVLKRLCTELQFQVNLFHAADKSGKAVYHTNVVMHAGTNYVLLCEDSISSANERALLCEKIEQSGKELIPVSAEQMVHFCGNMLQLKSTSGQPLTICSSSAARALSPQQKKRMLKHAEMVVVEIPVIEQTGGGSIRCMLAEIFLNEKMVRVPS